MTQSLADAVSTFGADVKSSLSNPAIKGEPEDQLRAEGSAEAAENDGALDDQEVESP